MKSEKFINGSDHFIMFFSLLERGGEGGEGGGGGRGGGGGGGFLNSHGSKTLDRQHLCTFQGRRIPVK